jgi:hypothetical protein
LTLVTGHVTDVPPLLPLDDALLELFELELELLALALDAEVELIVGALPNDKVHVVTGATLPVAAMSLLTLVTAAVAVR